MAFNGGKGSRRFLPIGEFWPPRAAIKNNLTMKRQIGRCRKFRLFTSFQPATIRNLPSPAMDQIRDAQSNGIGSGKVRKKRETYEAEAAIE